PKVETMMLFYDVPSGGSNVTTIVSLGEGYASHKGNGKREVVRKAVGSAVKDVKAAVKDETVVSVDASTDPHTASKFVHFLLKLLPLICLLKLSLLTWHFTSSH